MTYNIAFLSLADPGDFFIYDDLTIPFFKTHGIHVETIPWSSINTDWAAYDMVIVRSTWDYQNHPDAFMDTLGRIATVTRLENAYTTIEMNLQKTYLKMLEQQGVPIVPTRFYENFKGGELSSAADAFDVDEVVIKPVISANADDTFRIKREDFQIHETDFMQRFNKRACLIQPFLPTILDPGEYSVFLFNGDVSHAILKTPKSGDFRVQEEHGGQLQSVEINRDLVDPARAAVKGIHPLPLYARVDLIRHRHQFVVMEVELIEPSLYFNMDLESPRRFVDAVRTRLTSH